MTDTQAFEKRVGEILRIAHGEEQQQQQQQNALPLCTLTPPTDVNRRQLLEAAHDLSQFDGHTNAERSAMGASLLRAMTAFWNYRKGTFMGFQASQGLESNKERLGDMMNMQLNNIGDPFYDDTGFRMNCKVAERAVLKYYGELWCGEKMEGADTQPGGAHAPAERQINATSGYVTCMGSTEGNIYICRQARDYLKGKFLLPEYKMVFAKRTDADHVPSLMLSTNATRRAEKGDVEVVVRQDGVAMKAVVSTSSASNPSQARTRKSSISRPPVRSLLPERFVLAPNAFREPIILYSNASHYSIGKIKDMLEIHTPKTFFRGLMVSEPHPKPSDIFTAEQAAQYFPDDVWPTMVSTYEDGTMNVAALGLLVKLFFSMGNPVFVVCNFATTFTGAHDCPRLITATIRAQPGCVEETTTTDNEGGICLTRRNYFIGVDGALGAAYGPYFDSAHQHAGKPTTRERLAAYMAAEANSNCPYIATINTLQKELDERNKQRKSEHNSDAAATTSSLVKVEDIILPSFNLREVDGEERSVMAVSMSTHKFLGAPTPGGIVLTVQKYMLNFTGDDVSYIGSPDTSISGSRSGLNVMFVYDYLTRHSHERQIAKYYASYSLARYAAQCIAEALGTTVMSVARDKFSSTITNCDGGASPLSVKIPAVEPSHLEAVLDAADKGQPNYGKKPPTVFHFPGSLSVIFPRPSAAIIDKYSLSCDALRLLKAPYAFPANFPPTPTDIENGAAMPETCLLKHSKSDPTRYFKIECAHAFMMSHVTVAMVKALAEDLRAEMARGDNPQLIGLSATLSKHSTLS